MFITDGRKYSDSPRLSTRPMPGLAITVSAAYLCLALPYSTQDQPDQTRSNDRADRGSLFVKCLRNAHSVHSLVPFLGLYHHNTHTMATAFRPQILRQAFAAAPAKRVFSSGPLSSVSAFRAARVSREAPLASAIKATAAFHTSQPRPILPPLPQVIKGTINDAAKTPDASYMHGSYHWSFERYDHAVRKKKECRQLTYNPQNHVCRPHPSHHCSLCSRRLEPSHGRCLLRNHPDPLTHWLRVRPSPIP